MGTSIAMDKVWTKFVTTRRPDLRDELITEYAPLVRFVVSRLGIPPTSLLEAEDLISYGMIVLINAIDRFDPHCGHLSTIERPEAVNAALGAWLEA